MRRHSREGGNPDLRFSEIFSDYRSMGFAHGYGLQKCQLRRVFIYSRGQSPRYGCRLQIPASRLKKQFLHPCLLRRYSRAGGNPDLRLSEIFNDYRSMDFAHGCSCRNIGLDRAFMFYLRNPPYFQTTVLVKLNV